MKRQHIHQIYTGGNKIPGLKFQGELMTCLMCGQQQKSDPKVESGWTYLEADGKGFYVCPSELPGSTGTREEFARAYEKILEKVVSQR